MAHGSEEILRGIKAAQRVQGRGRVRGCRLAVGSGGHTSLSIFRGPELGDPTGHILILVIGFVVALVFSWAFELTAEGLKRTEDVDVTKSVTKSTGRKLDFVIIAILLLIIGIFAYQRFAGQKVESGAGSQVPEKSIAVLPFENRSEDKVNAYFADGIQDEIQTRLSKIAVREITLRSAIRSGMIRASKNSPRARRNKPGRGD